MAAPNHRKAKGAASTAGSAATLSTAASEMLRSLGLDAVDPEHVFELQSKEGAGAFGRVFRACYKHDRTRLAALKVIPVALEAGQRGEDIESVRKEIQFLRECDHPNVVAFYGAYYKDGALWVAMEYCGGGSVGDVRRARELREDEIAVIMRGALRGLAYLHSKKKIHRDIKGGNILLTSTGQVKIADFGVSAQLRDTMSRRGTFVGTPYWMSPEMIQDSDYDYKSDIWSLGITAIELADQKPPLFDEHPMRVLIQIPRNPPPQLKRPSAWTPLFAQFLRFCLQKDPLERPSALECLDHAFIAAVAHIDRVFASSTTSTTAAPAPTDVTNTSQQHDRSSESAAVPAAALAQSPAASELPSTPVAEPVALAAADLSTPLPPADADADADVLRAAEPEHPLSALSAPEAKTQVSDDTVDDGGNGDDIAEDIARLDDGESDSDNGSDASATRGRASGQTAERHGSSNDESSDDSNSSDDDDGDDDGDEAAHANRSSRSSASSSTVRGSDSFSFRQPTVATSTAASTAAASTAAADAHVSLSMVSGDELLELSVSESTDVLPDMKTRTVRGTGSQSAQALPLPALSASASEPPTELRLLPASSASPLTKHRRSAGFGASATASFSIGSHLDASSDVAESAPAAPAAPAAATTTAPAPPSRRETLARAHSAITATPKSLASVSSTWQNPLADIPTTALGATSARLNGLLNLSLSSSLTSSSTRLFAKLLHDEEQARTRLHSPSNSINSSSRYATPRGELTRSRVDDRSSSVTLPRVLQTSFTLTPSAAAGVPRHRYTRSSVSASTSTHLASSPLIASHNASTRTLQPVRAAASAVSPANAPATAAAIPASSLDPPAPPLVSARSESVAREATRSGALSDASPVKHLDSTDLPESLDARIRHVVDSLWTELATHGIDSVETLRTSPLVRIACFARYQRSVLTLVATFAKQRDAKRWADAALARSSSETGAVGEQQLPLPGSLQCVARWLRAALSADALLELLVSEWTTRDKLAQLCERYPMLLSKTMSARQGSSCDHQTLAPARTHALLHQLDTATLGARSLHSHRSNQDDDDDDARDDETQWLKDGARELVERATDNGDDGSISERMQRIETIVATGKREPAIATIVSGLSKCAALSPHLARDDGSQEALRSVVQAALQTHLYHVLS